MKVAILHYVCGVSAKELAEWLRLNDIQADIFRMSDTDKRNFMEYDYVFAYGMGSGVRCNNIINNAHATALCIDKVETFNVLKKANVPTVNFCTHYKDVPRGWNTVVCRKSTTGRRADDMILVEQGEKLPVDYKLFSEYFYHKYEYRVVVFKGEIVGHYFKKHVGEGWEFKLQPNKGFEEMDKACLKAANALGIDYVGFDVVANTKKDFRILEANSGPVLTDEAGKVISEFFLNL